MIGSKGTRLVAEPLPIVGGRPWYFKNLMSKQSHGIRGLAELPVPDASGTTQRIEKIRSRRGGAVASGAGPSLRPADLMIPDIGTDGATGKAFDETLTGSGRLRGHEAAPYMYVRTF